MTAEPLIILNLPRSMKRPRPLLGLITACRSQSTIRRPEGRTVLPKRLTAETESSGWHEHAARLRQEKAKHAVQVLEERGLIKSLAGDRQKLVERLTSQRVSAYSGIDPTAPSLHLGHLIPLNTLFWLFACGHTAISLVRMYNKPDSVRQLTRSRSALQQPG